MRTKKSMNRRRFLKTSAVSIAGAGLFSSAEPGLSEEKNNTAQVKIKEYRTLGRTGFKASDIGVGKPFDAAVLRALLDAGVNYIDTAEGYGRGRSERVIGEVIKDRDRKSLFITSKLGMYGNPTKEQILVRARQCLQNIGSEYLDCMMIHGCSTVEALKHPPFHEAMAQLKKEGKLRFVGMSNHGGNYNDVPEPMETVHLAAVKDGRFDLLLLVYNFLKRDMGENILAACREKNIGAVLMKVNPVGSYHAYKSRLEEAEKKGQPTERLRGVVDRLKKRVETAQDFIKKHNLTDSEAIRSAAYRFVLNNKNAHSALFNFSNFDEVDSVLKVSGSRLSGNDKKTLAALSQGCGDLYCRHACGVCENTCPAGVPVNTIMRYNHYFDAQKREKYAVEKYAALPTAKADRCYGCAGNCEQACPYGVPIHGLLLMAHHNLTLA
jgi:predicted aldo/keto reductase-like oxidoreductase